MGRDFGDIIDRTTMKPQTEESFEKLVKGSPNAPITFENTTKEDLYKALAHPISITASDAFVYLDKKSGELMEDFDTPFDSVISRPQSGGHVRSDSSIGARR